MDSDQTLQALQNAYADLFLNTSNQEAAKVLAAERKAQQLEHELQVTKDKSAEMMIRLKKMLDDKISEAKMTSRNQQERIDELEAQLGEAEDIVSELREELRYVQADCKRVTTNDVQHAGKHDNATSEEAFADNRQSQSLPCHSLELAEDSLVGSDKENLYPNHRTGYGKCSSEAIQMRDLYGPMPELPSILLRSKEHRLYKSRCTQRIHAKMLNQANTKVVCKEGCVSCLYEVQTIDLILKAAKTATNTKYRKKKTATSKKIPERLFRKLHETGGVPQSESATKSVESRAKPSEGPTCVAPKLPSNMTGTVTQLECAKTTRTCDHDNKGDIEKLISKGEPPVDSLVLIVLEEASTECSDIQVCTQNIIKVNESTPPPELNNINGTTKASSLQHFKYTYRRKRKRET